MKDNPKLIQALKDGKQPLEYLVLDVLEGDAAVHKLGADKYGIRNWRIDKIKASTYIAAILRHLFAWARGETIDPESGVSHLYHIRACCAILLDSDMQATLIDDRDHCESIDQTPGVDPVTEFYEDRAHTPTMKEIIDLERPTVHHVDDLPDGPWDVVFKHVVDEQYGSLDEQRRGPWETVAEAADYMERNPERIPGSATVQISTMKVHTTRKTNA